MTDPQIIWFRQDLRLADQAAVAAAARAGPVIAVYVLDDETPGNWRIGGAQRWWLHHSLAALAASLEAQGVPLVLRRGRAGTVIPELVRTSGAGAVHALWHYEPWARVQQAEVAAECELQLHDGNYLLPPGTVRTGSGGPFRIFTPFWRALQQHMPPPPPTPVPALTAAPVPDSDTLADWQLLPTRPDWSKGFNVWTPGEAGAHAALDAFAGKAAAYDRARNFPAEAGSSRLSPHLHFGEVSPGQVWHAVPDSDSYRREIAWRDFAAGLIDTFPDSHETPGRAQFVDFAHRDAPDELRAWQQGRTGYPIVDAGMRELWATGWMHNRVRMIAASFLVKHLLIDWRAGSRWFWDTLVDADLGNNSLGWQWIMGSGVDSSPFNRIFAPVTQSAKFDASAYIRKWVPELARVPEAAIHAPWEAGGARGYPPPLVDHAVARARALAAYAATRA
ncbi:cryptochrome/photolyase family protein [Glacieibacterium frigidum]|uniref:Deoxyribodipyrimidine photo-lyase n=1 Tax=Glacieibacterium frigidum TaxID=2593303 RepID=A0A552U974_9SPHN|nr:deoxyribodipyrimidine photo-lyase [Glacieibacterium frigidum]TRW14762.1 deoxyribodipyrimidine photo-lyase [Glacieibacterium frigidum]